MSLPRRSSDVAGRLTATCLLLAATIAVARPLAAQVVSSGARPDSLRDRTTVALSAGFTSRSRLDQTASPVPYAGAGAGASVQVAVPLGRWRVRTALAGDVQRMAPTTPTLDSRERFIDGAWTSDLVRPAIAGALGDLLLGAMTNAELSITNHGYADPRATTQTFLLGTAWLGPAAQWKEQVGSGVLSASVGAPAVGAIDHPYGDVKTQHTGLRFHGATPATLRGAATEVAFTSAATGRYAMRYAYRLSSVGVRDVQPVHGTGQSVSVGVIRRLW